ncbi:DUF4190 domain-containing protein [Nocardia rhizosphaerihabitans]|uniref:DUF4190 domain-containing protein n=1 Tax=Nocardia rhizosphaerihabitans TaxID=1691570 RepID=A0ABQ2KK86_9NOCA|nr:DUF4190 domain-containing protein [Nocardia rhizosphaerihabitans]GGN83842.1 hypothetical protein GCM10011610_36540 [Nocardia rhizosphaerihabitans]
MAIPNQPIGETVEHPQANLILVLGLLSPFCCGIFGPVAWVLGKRALNQIDESYGALSGRSQVMIGYIAGIIGTILMVMFALLYLAGSCNGNF